jgi:ubiquinone/menaquinone biosynthesis C-methylase UbiE
MNIIYLVLAAIVFLVFVGLSWRWASQWQQIPFPAWLSWLFLDNPIVEIVINTPKTIDRIGLYSGEHGIDIGCGSGRLAIPAAKKVGLSGRIVAFDIQPEMLKLVKQKANRAGLSNIIIHCGDITTDNTFSPNSFDRVWLVTVLGEIPEQVAALKNIYRLLKPGGILSVTEILGDPHYQTRGTVLNLGQKVGFEPYQNWGNFLSFTQNFIKPE